MDSGEAGPSEERPSDVARTNDIWPISEELEKRFTYHPPKDDQVRRYERLRIFAKNLAYAIEQACPNSRERSLALTNLEQAVMWANASIARHS